MNLFSWLNFSKKRKLILVSIMAVLILAVIVLIWAIRAGKLNPKAETTLGQTFPDVPDDYWAYTYIEAAYHSGIVQGYPDGTYHPEEIVNRAQMAVFVSRAMAGGDENIPDGPTDNSFPDVPQSFWAYKWIEYLYSQGIVGGYDEQGTHYYHPEYDINRAQMAVFVSRAMVGGESGLSDYTPPTEATFSDVATDYWAYKWIEYLVGEGIVSGYPDNTYRPEEKITRAQMAVFIAKAFDLAANLVSNISGRLIDNFSQPLANGFVLIDEEVILQADANGNYSLDKFDSGVHEFYIYDQDGYQYQSPNLDDHIRILDFGDQQVDFTGLVKNE